VSICTYDTLKVLTVVRTFHSWLVHPRVKTTMLQVPSAYAQDASKFIDLDSEEGRQ
jgi:hypothetical protein